MEVLGDGKSEVQIGAGAMGLLRARNIIPASGILK